MAAESGTESNPDWIGGDSEVDPVVVGNRLRSARAAQGMGLRELARRIGVSPSFISQIERGKAMPSVATLYAIIQALQISLDDLFAVEEEAPASVAESPATTLVPGPTWDNKRNGGQGTARLAGEGPVVRSDQRDSIQLATGVRWERLTANADPEVDFIYAVYEPGAASAEAEQLIRHHGKEYGFVLSGTLEVTIGFDSYELHAGDSISFDSTVPHCLRASEREPAVVVWLVVGRSADPRAAQSEPEDRRPTQ